MEPSDLPLIVPIERTIMSMFQDTLDELETMKENFSLEEKEALEQQEREEKALLATQQEEVSVPPIGGLKGGAKPKPKGKAGAKVAVEPTEEEIRQKEEMEKLRKKKLENPPARDRYRELAEDLKNEENSYAEAAAPYSNFVHRRLEFLNSKQPNQYMIEDILGEWITDAPEGGVHESMFDSSKIAEELTSTLSSKYGYKLPRGLHEVGKVEPVEEDEDQTRGLLSTHGAGGKDVDKDFVCSVNAHNTMMLGTVSQTQAREPSPPAGEPPAASTKGASVRAAASIKSPNKSITSIAGKSGNKNDSVSHSKSFLAAKNPVEASHTEVNFVNCLPGHSYEQVVTFWNKDANLRLFKLSPSPTPLIKVEPITKGYTPQSTIAPGCSIQVKISYHPRDAAPVNIVLKLGHARDKERMSAEENQLSQWSFFEMPVNCGALEPNLILLTEDCQHERVGLDLDPTFCFSQSEAIVKAVNHGGAGDFVVTVPEPYAVEPATFSLLNGEEVDLCVKFLPDETHREVEGNLTITANLAGHTAVETQVVKEVPLSCSCCIPSVWLEGIGTATLESNSDTNVAEVPEPPLLVLEDACIGYTSTKTVCVRNDSVLPISFSWDCCQSSECGFSVFPQEGVLHPERSTVFTVEIDPKNVEKVECLMKMMLHGLPQVPEDHSVPFLSRTKKQPKLVGSDARDPFHLFGSPVKEQPGASNEPVPDQVYCCSVRLAADPTELAAHIAPEEILNSVPLLVRQPNYREFTLVNSCNRELDFWLDPPRGDDHPAADLDEEARKRLNKKLRKLKELFGAKFVPPQKFERDGIDLEFSPQRGTIPGNGTVTIGVTFTINFLGPQDIDVECFFPQLDNDERSKYMHIHAIAKGPSAHTSTDLIDFGIVAVGEENEARLTVTNHNPIPLSFFCRDPSGATGNKASGEGGEALKYVFLPPGAPLKPGQSTELTVYRRGDAVGEVRERIEIATHEGESVFVNVRANIQKPKCYITPTNVNFGDVDRDIPSYQEIKLANLSAVDIQYELVVIEAPETITVGMNKPQGVLYAGESNIPVSIEATFHGQQPSTALIALHSPQLDEPVPFEVTCDKVNQLSISLEVTPTATEQTAQPPAAYFMKDLLANLLNDVFAISARNAGDVVVLDDPKPYCEPVKIHNAVIPPGEPFCSASATISLANHSGCYTKYILSALHYDPVLPANPTMEATGATAAVAPGGGAGTNTMQDTLLAKTNSGLNGTKSMGGTMNATNKKSLMSGTQKSQLGGTQRSGTMVSKKGGGSKKEKEARGPPEKKIALNAFNPTFTAKALDGREQIENEQKSVLNKAQNLLLDGRGCAAVLYNYCGDLKGHSMQQITLDLVSNLPGLYNEKIAVHCDGVAPVDLDVSFKVKGMPIIIDPFTSGLALDPQTGLQRLLLPSMVGGMSSIKRKIRITSRCPRDLLVDVKLVEKESFFRVSVVNTPVPSSSAGSEADDKISLNLGMAGADETDGEQQSAGTVSPSGFVLPALESTEVVIEYAPHQGQLGSWTGNMVISSTLAQTAFNDRFLIDEFYQKNKSRFPCSRTVSAIDGVGAQRTEKFQMRGVPKVLVKYPLIDRPNIVRDTQVIYPDETLLLMAKHDKKDEDSDDERDVHFDAEYEARAKAIREKLAEEEAERQELLQYVAERRVKQCEELHDYFLSTEMVVVANNVEPRLTTDPDRILRFPMCKVGGQCHRTVHLSNPHVTPFDFRVECSLPFKITRAALLSTDGADEELKKDRSLAASRKLPEAKFASLRGTNPHSDPSSTLFRLYPQQTVAVTVELSEFTTEKKHQIEGELHINFSNGAKQSLQLLATVHVPTLTSEPAMTWFRPSVALENGRPQPKYARTIKLVNFSTCEAPFTIAHKAADRPISRGTETLSRMQKAQQTLKISPLQSQALVLDDPTRFQLSLTEGIVPPMSLGGAPGTLDVVIHFDESATTTFECKYQVTVQGGAGCEFTVRGDSKETEL